MSTPVPPVHKIPALDRDKKRSMCDRIEHCKDIGQLVSVRKLVNPGSSAPNVVVSDVGVIVDIAPNACGEIRQGLLVYTSSGKTMLYDISSVALIS
mgnify:CR=1 FL=1